MKELIKKALACCGFSTCDESINGLISWAMHHMVDDEYGLQHLDIDDWLMTIGISSPDCILPSHLYYHKKLDDDLVHKMCCRLNRKFLKATKKEIHALCYDAVNLNENLDTIQDLNHAINYVIVMFSKGGWYIPNGFEEEFTEYAEKSLVVMPKYVHLKSKSEILH